MFPRDLKYFKSSIVGGVGGGGGELWRGGGRHVEDDTQPCLKTDQRIVVLLSAGLLSAGLWVDPSFPAKSLLTDL